MSGIPQLRRSRAAEETLLTKMNRRVDQKGLLKVCLTLCL